MIDEIETIPFDKDVHYDTIQKWWEFYYKDSIIPKDCLPETGCVALKAGKPAGCSFVYKTDSKIAIMTFCIADPDLGPLGRTKFIDASAKGVTAMAREFLGDDGFLWGYTSNATVARIWSQNGMECVEEADIFILPFGRTDKDFLE